MDIDAVVGALVEARDGGLKVHRVIEILMILASFCQKAHGSRFLHARQPGFAQARFHLARHRV
jgi:hypothetical protein